MVNVNPKLLLLDVRQAALAPNAIHELLVEPLPLRAYLQHVIDDLAQGWTPADWAGMLAELGALPAARICWQAAELPEAEIDELYVQARETLVSRLGNNVDHVKWLVERHASDLNSEVRASLRNSIDYIDQHLADDWFDEASEAVDFCYQLLQTHLDDFIGARYVDVDRALSDLQRHYTRRPDRASNQPRSLIIKTVIEESRALINEEYDDIGYIQRLLDYGYQIHDGRAIDQAEVRAWLGADFADELRDLMLPSPPPPVEPKPASPAPADDLMDLLEHAGFAVGSQAETESVEDAVTVEPEAVEAEQRLELDRESQELPMPPADAPPADVLPSETPPTIAPEAITQFRQRVRELNNHLKTVRRFASGDLGALITYELLVHAWHSLDTPEPDGSLIWGMIQMAEDLCNGGQLDLARAEQLLGQHSVQALISQHRPAPRAKRDSSPTQPRTAPSAEDIVKSQDLSTEANAHRTTRRFEPAEQKFKAALQLWPGNEHAVKNYANMLRQLGRTHEAIKVLEAGLEHARDLLPFYNLLTGYHTDVDQFKEARRYAQQGLRMAGDIRAEIGVLHSLVTIEVRNQNLPQAIDYCDAILRLDPQREHVKRQKQRLKEIMLSGQSPDQQDVVLDWNVERLISEAIETQVTISRLLDEDLDQCEFTKVDPRIIARSDPQELSEEADRLMTTGTQWDVRQPKERADFFLQASKLLIQASKTRDFSRPLQTSLNNYTGAMGEYFLLRGRYDSARAYFLEHIALFERWLPNYTLYRVAGYLQTYVSDDESLTNIVRRRLHRNVRELLKDLFLHAYSYVDVESKEAFLEGMVELGRVNRILREVCVQAISHDTQMAEEFKYFLLNMSEAYSVALTSGNPADMFLQVVELRRMAIERVEDSIIQIFNSFSERRQLPEVNTTLSNLTDHQYIWYATDSERFLRVREIFQDALRYFEEPRFEQKDSLAVMILNQISRFSDMLDETPTYFARAHFSRLIYRVRRLVEEDHRRLKAVSLPQLVPEIVNTQWVDDLVRECHIEIVNEGESTAHDVGVRVLESETGSYFDDPTLHRIKHRSIYARPHSATIAIPIHLVPEAMDQDAVDLRIRLEYHDRENTLKVTEPLRLSLPLKDEVTFMPFANPYRTGLPVRENEMFYGRDQFVEELVNEISRPERTSAVVIYGQKRSGKTSILHHVAQNVDDWVVPVLFTMQSVLMEEDLAINMFFLIADEISQAYSKKLGEYVEGLDWETLSKPPGPSVQFRLYLRKLRRDYPDLRLVLLIDEFTELSGKIDEGYIDSDIMKFLKSLIEQGFFSCVLCGIDTMPDVLKKYSNQLAISDPRQVGYLDDVAAEKLIDYPMLMPDGRSRFTSRAVINEIINLTAGSPYYIQFVCHRLVRYLHSQRKPSITGADVDRVITDLLEGRQKLDPFSKFDNLFRYKESPSQDTYETVIEGLFLYLLADETRTRQYAPLTSILHRVSFVEASVFADMADQLESRGVIERTGIPVQYRIVVDLFRRWINTNRQLDNDMIQRFRERLEDLES